MTVIKIKKVKRDCPANENAEPGERLIYDYNAMIDGEHRLTFSVEFRGRGYRVHDTAHQPITWKDATDGYRQRGLEVRAKRQFVGIVEQLLALNRVPSVKSQIDFVKSEAAKAVAKKAEEEADRAAWEDMKAVLVEAYRTALDNLSTATKRKAPKAVAFWSRRSRGYALAYRGLTHTDIPQ